MKELALASDTTSCWMAHYCAELIKKAETATGPERANAERECAEVILQLWEHRASLATRRRPLEAFTPILETLTSLSNKGTGWYFSVTKKPRTDEIGKLLDLAENVDEAARSIIKWILAQASAIAVNTEEDWLEEGLPFTQAPEQDILQVLRVYAEMAGKGEAPELEDLKVTELTKIREKLGNLLDASNYIIATIERELRSTKKAPSKVKKKRSK